MNQWAFDAISSSLIADAHALPFDISPLTETLKINELIKIQFINHSLHKLIAFICFFSLFPGECGIEFISASAFTATDRDKHR